MKQTTFAVLAVMFSAYAAAADTLGHPDLPIMSACATNMQVDGNTIGQRILDVGWIEVAAPPAMITTDTITRTFEDPAQSGIATLSIEDSDASPQEDGFWSCEILLFSLPTNILDFMENPPEGVRETEQDGTILVSVERRRSELAEFVSLLPFMPPAKLFYVDYSLPKKRYIEKMGNQERSVVFSAEFNVIYPF